MRILVTGGAGYIGSHACLELLHAGYDVVDVAAIYADASKAKAALHWTATRGLEAMCADVWRWQAHNPQGYEET